MSNFRAWEVVEFVKQAEAHGWVKPTVYQGSYNAIERSAERESVHPPPRAHRSRAC